MTDLIPTPAEFIGDDAMTELDKTILEFFLREIRSAVDCGEHSVNIRYYEMYDFWQGRDRKIVDKLCAKGWDITRNGACLWWEVRW